MANYAYVDPTDVSAIALVDFPPPEASRAPVPFVENGLLLYWPRTPDPGLRTGTMGAQSQAGFGIYQLVRGSEQAPGNPQYYTITRSYAFRNAGNTGPGAIGDDASIVQETLTYSAISADDLYEIRAAELAQQAQLVEDQGRLVTGLSNGDRALQTRDDLRVLYLSMVAQAALPGVTAFKVADQFGVFFPLTIADAQIAVDQIVVFHDAVRLANTDSLNNTMIGHRDASVTPGDAEWQALADVDLTQGWPEAPVDPATK